MTAEVVIRIRGLVNQFGKQVIHDGLDLDVMRGEVLGLVGGSGTGKSVLMNTVLGLNRPRAGTIELLGVDVARLDAAARAATQTRCGVGRCFPR
jgi:phospholipid/cholesterol/gamma-HCH transport system ATP-binding protein